MEKFGFAWISSCESGLFKGLRRPPGKKMRSRSSGGHNQRFSRVIDPAVRRGIGVWVRSIVRIIHGEGDRNTDFCFAEEIASKKRLAGRRQIRGPRERRFRPRSSFDERASGKKSHHWFPRRSSVCGQNGHAKTNERMTAALDDGRSARRAGDGAPVEFRRAVDAARCAVEVRNAMIGRNVAAPADRRIAFRIGVPRRATASRPSLKYIPKMGRPFGSPSSLSAAMAG